MAKKTCSIMNLFESGKLLVGDYVNYKPEPAEYRTNPKNTGCESQLLKNDRVVNYRVWDVNKENGVIRLFPEENPFGKVNLSGIAGYMNGPDELQSICDKLGRNSKLGAEACCITVEDVYEFCAYVPDKPPACYAYYPMGTKVNGTILHGGNEYKKVSLWSKEARFYKSDGGGIEKIDFDGFKYRSPKKNDPVLVANTYFDYDLGHSIFGIEGFWLASPCVGCSSSYAHFRVRYTSSSLVGAICLYRSDGGALCNSYGVRPLVSLSSMLQMDISDENIDGSTSEKAWKFAEPVSFYQEDDMNSAETNDAKSQKQDYKIVSICTYRRVDFQSSFEKFETEVNKLMNDGYKPIGNLQVTFEKDCMILCREMVKVKE